jgi:hypothetical protein
MLVGTPPSLHNEHFPIEQAMATTTASIPTEILIEYECCVCRLTKSDSESPIGLIGTSCLSLCKTKLIKIKIFLYILF